MDPILENAIVEVLNQTAETCRKAKAKLDPEPYLWEASESLKTILVGRIYDYMAYIDKTMRGKDWPEHKIRLRVSDKIAKMSELVEQHAAAVNLISVSPQPQTLPEIELIEQIANELEECVRTEPNDRVPAKLGHYLRDIKSLEGFSTVLEWLQWHKPAVADWVEKKYNKLFLDIKAIDQAIADSNSWLRPMCALQNLQRDIVELAKGLRHIAEMARSDLTPEKPTEAKHDITPAEEQEEKAKEIPSINIQDSNVILGDVKAENLQIGDNARIDKKPEAEKPTKTKPNRKTPIVAIIIFLIVDSVFELLVYFVPFTWLKNHPNSYGLQVSIIFLIPCLIVGLFKPQYRKWCWGVAGLAFLLLIVSLLGGRSR